MKWLYRYEAKKIQSYILATERLQEMTGASALVDSLGSLLDEALEGRGERIMVAAGQATVVFDHREDLERFASKWPMLVAHEVPGLQIVQGFAPMPEGGERRALAEVASMLDADRNRPLVDLPEAGPLLARAGRTGMPAINRQGRGGSLLDAATWAKAERARRDGRADAFARRLGVDEARGFITDMEDFGEGYVAVVHADGNGVGRRIVDKVFPEGTAAQQRFSAALSRATENAAKEAVRLLAANVGAGPQRATLLPLRPLVLGGDDFTALVSAAHAVAFVDGYLRAFEAETARAKEELFGPLTACAGIALVKPGFPFHRAHALAEDLCKLAKRRAMAESCSSFLMHRVTAATFDSLDDVLVRELGAAAPSGEGRGAGGVVPGALLGGPWSVTPRVGKAVALLDALARALRALPRGPMREWLQVVRTDAGRAAALWKRMRENALGEPRRARDWNELANALAALGADPETGRCSDGSTPVFDAVVLNAVGAVEVLWRETP